MPTVSSASRSIRHVLAGLGVLLMSACVPASPAPGSTDTRSSGAVLPGGGSVSTSAPGSPTETVADFFSPPPPDPGPRWTKAGKTVDERELMTAAGPRHCDWESTVMMHLGWPLGTESKTFTGFRQFIRDPEGVFTGSVDGSLAVGGELPADAQDTGYRTGDVELWLSPSDPEGAYLRLRASVERWPRVDPIAFCR